MSLGEMTKRNGAQNCLVEEKILKQVDEEIESNVRRKGLWAKALQKCRSNEQKANVLYIKYRAQSIKDEADIAKVLSKEPPAAIIQNYISKALKQEPVKKKQLQKVPSVSMSQKDHKKKCYKCGKVVSLAIKPCPHCNCNSYVFCG